MLEAVENLGMRGKTGNKFFPVTQGFVEQSKKKPGAKDNLNRLILISFVLELGQFRLRGNRFFHA